MSKRKGNPKKYEKEIVYIGRDFYYKSGTMMSSLYQKFPDGSFKRYDWGFAECDLEEGIGIRIRKATREEVAIFTKELEKRKG
jgi:hypothetical protein